MEKSSKINYDNVVKNKCVICDNSLREVNFITCQNCNAVSQINYKVTGPNVLDVKSTCCNADVNIQQKITCSDLCHRKLVDYMIEEKGEYQKVIDMVTGKAHRIPTRIIIEDGITQTRLKEFPEWVPKNGNDKRDQYI